MKFKTIVYGGVLMLWLVFAMLHKAGVFDTTDVLSLVLWFVMMTYTRGLTKDLD